MELDGRDVVKWCFFGCVLMLTVYRLQQKKMPSWGAIEGGFFAFLVIGLTSEVAPNVAAASACLVTLSVFLEVGPSVLKSANTSITKTKTPV